jgi:ssDNA-binding Zn-finger/Zn-ribbon topoisomerase 1
VYCEECLEKDIESIMILREGKFGDFWGCSRYPQCTYTLNERQYKLAFKDQNEE